MNTNGRSQCQVMPDNRQHIRLNTNVRHFTNHYRARLITRERRRDHITPMLCQLHWLPVRRRVEFKLACLVRQALCGQMPIYLADDIPLVSEGNRRSLRSSADNMCAVPCTPTALGTEALALSAREFETVCHVACD